MELKTALFSFKGRMRRSEFNTLWLPIVAVLTLVSFINSNIGFISFVLLLWPMFALTTKRYHDFNSNGLIGLFQLLPWFGTLVVIIGCSFTIGDFKDNKYGPSSYNK